MFCIRMAAGTNLQGTLEVAQLVAQGLLCSSVYSSPSLSFRPGGLSCLQLPAAGLGPCQLSFNLLHPGPALPNLACT